jgi:hypothetical protein
MLKHAGRIVAAASVFLALIVSIARADDSERLFRWTLKAGETLKFRMVQEMAQKLQTGEGGPPIAISTKMTMDQMWKVDSVDDKGVITLDQSLQNIS